MPSLATVKQEAQRIVEQLSEDASWDDLLFEIFVRQTIEVGLKDCKEGHTLPVPEVKRRLGLPT
jgi:hypothetical protein